MEGLDVFGVVFVLLLLFAARAEYLTIRAAGKDGHQLAPASSRGKADDTQR